jgi:CRP-like cAMP-binding protein
MVDLSSIEGAGILRELTNPDLAELGAIASEQEFERRDCLFERGAEAKNFYVATRGRFVLSVDLRVFDGHASMAVEEKGALDAFGWSALVKPYANIYSCHCIEAGAAITFPREELSALLRSNCRLGEEFLHNLNNLIGARVRVFQQLWLEEVSQSMARVQHWTHTELTRELTAILTDGSPHRVRGWFRKHLLRGAGT